MKVTILQTDIRWAQPKENQVVAERLISDAPQSDLYVLPEMWTTGFATNPEGIAEDLADESSLDWMKETAARHRCAVCGSISVRTPEGEYRNRHYFVLPDGAFYFYDKRHLFTFGGESEHYKAGEKRTVAVYKGVRFLLQTCYDLRFPMWQRNNEDYDVMVSVANWPDARQGVWDILLRARAIENQCYAIGANRVGNDVCCSYAGGSAVVDAKGNIIAKAEGNGEQCITADIDMESLNRFRAKFPVLKDRDIF